MSSVGSRPCAKLTTSTHVTHWWLRTEMLVKFPFTFRTEKFEGYSSFPCYAWDIEIMMNRYRREGIKEEMCGMIEKEKVHEFNSIMDVMVREERKLHRELIIEFFLWWCCFNRVAMKLQRLYWRWEENFKSKILNFNF